MGARSTPDARRGRYASAALLFAAALTIALSQSASGSGASGLRYPSHRKLVPSKEVGRTRDSVACPRSHPVPTGGGFEITGNQSGLDLEVGTTETSPHQLGWLNEANNNSGSPAHLTTTAICAKGRFATKDRVRSVGGDDQARKDVLCPPGTQVVGGGVETGSPSPKVEVASSEPIDGPDAGTLRDDGWRGIVNNGRAGSIGMAVQAICARSGSYKYVQTRRTSIADNSQRSDRASCPAKTQVAGGGIDITGINDGIEVAGGFPFDGGDRGSAPDDGWEGVANNDDTGGAQRMQVFAICRS